MKKYLIGRKKKQYLIKFNDGKSDEIVCADEYRKFEDHWFFVDHPDSSSDCCVYYGKFVESVTLLGE